MSTAHYGIMKFELKTENDHFYNQIYSVFVFLVSISIIIIMCNISLKLTTISRFHEINYFCKLLSVDKSSYNFKKLSKLTNQKSKQKIWDLCREMVRF